MKERGEAISRAEVVGGRERGVAWVRWRRERRMGREDWRMVGSGQSAKGARGSRVTKKYRRQSGSGRGGVRTRCFVGECKEVQVEQLGE